MASSKKESAKSYLRWLASEDFRQKLLNKYGWLHSQTGFQRDLYQRSEYLAAAPFAAKLETFIQSYRKFKVNNKTASLSDIIYAVRMWPALGSSIGRHIALVQEDKQTIEEALANAQAETKRILYQSKPEPEERKRVAPDPSTTN